MAIRGRLGKATAPKPSRPSVLPAIGAGLLAAVGTWLVLRLAGVGQRPSPGVHGVGGVLFALLVWAVLTGGASEGGVVRGREHLDPAARAALLRLDRMDPVRLGGHVAALCRRDGLTGVETARVPEDCRSVDVTGTLPDGSRVTVRCRSAAGPATVSGAIVERFGAGPHAGHRLVLATTASGFSQRARSLAAADGPLLLDRRALARWDLATEIPEPLRAPHPSDADPGQRGKAAADTA